jgi:hypothetical protein
MRDLTTRQTDLIPAAQAKSFEQSIAKMFLLKNSQLEPKVLKFWAQELAKDGFIPAEIAKACEQVARDAGIKFTQYADIFEVAKPARDARRERDYEEQFAARERGRIARGEFADFGEARDNLPREEFLKWCGKNGY